jgi:tetratricopeptide (TPR) repeat protein
MHTLALRFFLALSATSLVLSGCVTGQKQFQTGEKAYQEGDLEAAELAYKQAVKNEPSNREYKAALDRVEQELAKRYEDEARAKEKNEDWKGASASWAKASEAVPSNQDYRARKALSGMKAQNLGPDEWYEGVKKVDAEIPKNAIVEKSLAGAKSKAVQYHIGLAEKFLSSSEGTKALEHFERAKEIDPAAPGLDSSHYSEATAFALMEQADAKLAAGDALEAHDLYQRALEKRPLPEIKAKLQKVKAKVSAVLSKVDAARALAQKGRHLEALKAYESIAGAKGVPSSVAEGMLQERSEVAKAEAEKAEKAAEKGDLARAKQSLEEALRYATLEPQALGALRTALSEIEDNRAGKGVRTIEDAKLDTKEPAVKATRAYATGSAKKLLDKAKAISKKDPSGALALIADLGPFEDSMPAIKDLRRELRAGSFLDTLDEAMRAAKKGDDEEAGTLMLAALNASNAPAELRRIATEACDALKSKKWVDAQVAFQKALSLEPRSKLAQKGVEIASLRRKEGEKKALDVLKSGSGDEDAAVDLLEAAEKAEANGASVKQGAALLLARVQAAKNASDSDLAKLVKRASRLAHAPQAAKAIDDGVAALERGDHGAAETAFGRALEAAPSLEVAKIARERSRERALAALKSGAKKAAEGDEGGAKTLAELLKKDTHDKEANGALNAILDKARSKAKSGDDQGAAHELELAALALSPAPGVKLNLDKGTKALASGKMDEAEKAFEDALELEPDNRAAKVGHEVAKAARAEMLSKALDSTRKGGSAGESIEVLKRTLSANPASPEARKAFETLVDEAKKQGEAGNDQKAAGLLDTANVVSKPEATRSAIQSANKLLADGKHEEAEAAYAKVSASKVADTGKEIAHTRFRAALVQASLELKNGGDVERGAKATEKLLKLEPTNADAKAAIDGAVALAEKAAASGDDKTAAHLLRAASQAAGESKDLSGAIMRYESGKFDDAVRELEKRSSDLARRTIALIKARKLGTLKAGLQGDDRKQAESIKAMLAADPTNKEAQAALQKLLDKAKASAAKGDEKESAAELDAAMVATGAKEDLANTIGVATTHLGEKRFAQAEKAFLDALDLAKDSRVAKIGAEIAKKGREKAEKDASAEIAKAADPSPPARVLQASLLIDPSSKVVKAAEGVLAQRARKASAKPDDADAAATLDALVLLENASSDVIEGVKKADALFAKGSYDEAEAQFAAIEKSRSADLGKELARHRRIAILKAELEQAKKENDVLKQSRAVGAILQLDKGDRTAQEMAKKLRSSVIDSRLAAARAEKELGKVGVAYVYYKRALDLDQTNAKAKAEIEAIESSLKSGLDLVVVVDPIVRAPSVPGTQCSGIEGPMREAMMSEGSKRQNLGAYILSQDWTAAVERKDPKAPQVTGALKVTLSECQCGSSVGKATMLWELDVPREKGAPAVKGAVDANLPAGMVPRDEQDGAGNNARAALSRRAAKALFDKIADEKGAIDLWLLSLAEQGVKQKDSALVADAYVRLLVKKPASIDPTRVSLVEQYLDAELK